MDRRRVSRRIVARSRSRSFTRSSTERRRFLTLSTLAALVCLSLSAFAETPRTPGLLGDNTINRHFGFFFRPDAGFGYLTSHESTSAGDLKVSGFASMGGGSVGGALTENLILGVHLSNALVSNPAFSLSGTSRNNQDAEVGMLGIGPELTYYFMPNNVYLSGTVAITRMTLSKTDGSNSGTDWGVGTRVALGKEWWVSDHWGLGLVGHVSYSANNDPASTGGGNLMSSWAFGAAFSATYN